MIEKERLKKLLKEHKVVYSIDTKCYCTDILDLHNNMSKIDYDDCGDVKLFTSGNWWHWFNLKDLFETKEEAEFALKYQNITRTETLSLPTWEEFNNQEKQIRFFKYPYNYACYTDLVNIGITEYYGMNGIEIFNKPATKENYYAACELCKKLFLGEEV